MKSDNAYLHSVTQNNKTYTLLYFYEDFVDSKNV